MSNHFVQFVRSVLEKGGVLAAGLGCLYLYKKKLIPKVFGPVSYGIISVGTIGIARFLVMSVQAKQNSQEKQMPGDVLEGILDKPNTEMRKEEILEKLREKVADKQQQKESDEDKPQNPKPESSSDTDQRKVPKKQSVRINIVEQYFSGYEECLKNSDADDYEAFEIPTEEEFEMVSKHVKKSDK